MNKRKQVKNFWKVLNHFMPKCTTGHYRFLISDILTPPSKDYDKEIVIDYLALDNTPNIIAEITIDYNSLEDMFVVRCRTTAYSNSYRKYFINLYCADVLEVIKNVERVMKDCEGKSWSMESGYSKHVFIDGCWQPSPKVKG